MESELEGLSEKIEKERKEGKIILLVTMERSLHCLRDTLVYLAGCRSLLIKSEPGDKNEPEIENQNCISRSVSPIWSRIYRPENDRKPRKGLGRNPRAYRSRSRHRK